MQKKKKIFSQQKIVNVCMEFEIKWHYKNLY